MPKRGRGGKKGKTAKLVNRGNLACSRVLSRSSGKGKWQGRSEYSVYSGDICGSQSFRLGPAQPFEKGRYGCDRWRGGGLEQLQPKPGERSQGSFTSRPPSQPTGNQIGERSSPGQGWAPLAKTVEGRQQRGGRNAKTDTKGNS